MAYRTMLKSWLVVLFGAALAAPAAAALAPGATAPNFEVPAARGGEVFEFSLSEALAEGPVVLYFYPKAFTEGCTIEARLFAEASDEFAALGARVIGLSGDDLETLKRFSVEECRNRFAVGADADLAIAERYGARMPERPDLASRSSFVIAPDGRILSALTESRPAPHIERALAVLRQWKASQEAS